jgi:hypothetical protein
MSDDISAFKNIVLDEQPRTVELFWALYDASARLDGGAFMNYPRSAFGDMDRWIQSLGYYKLVEKDVDPRGGIEGYCKYVRMQRR